MRSTPMDVFADAGRHHLHEDSLSAFGGHLDVSPGRGFLCHGSRTIHHLLTGHSCHMSASDAVLWLRLGPFGQDVFHHRPVPIYHLHCLDHLCFVFALFSALFVLFGAVLPSCGNSHHPKQKWICL